MTSRQIRSPSSATDSTERLLRDRRRRIRFCSSWEQTREQEEQKMTKEAWEKRSGKRLCISAVCRVDYRRWNRALEASLHLPLSRPGVHQEIEELVDITRHRTIIRSFQARFGVSILLLVALASISSWCTRDFQRKEKKQRFVYGVDYQGMAESCNCDYLRTNYIPNRSLVTAWRPITNVTSPLFAFCNAFLSIRSAEYITSKDVCYMFDKFIVYISFLKVLCAILIPIKWSNNRINRRGSERSASPRRNSFSFPFDQLIFQ